MKKLATIALALLCSAPALAQDNSVSISSGTITAGRVISISVSGGGTNGAMAASVSIGGDYSFEQIGNGPAVETFSGFNPQINFAKIGDYTGGVSVTKEIPSQTFTAEVGTPQVAQRFSGGSVFQTSNSGGSMFQTSNFGGSTFETSSFGGSTFQAPSFQVPSFQAPSFQNSFFSSSGGFFGN